jgi:hypothetical protein
MLPISCEFGYLIYTIDTKAGLELPFVHYERKNSVMMGWRHLKD